MSAHKLLLVDDDAGLLRLLSIRLERDGYTITTAPDGRSALVAIREFAPDLVITDLRMEGMDGAQLLDEIQQQWPGLPVLLITAHGTIPDAVDATQRGAIGFLTKPLDRRELMNRIEQALAASPGSGASDAWRAGVIGRSAALERVLGRARRVAASRASVLIGGPSGSGKEVLARAIHAASGRDGAFVALNAGAVPVELLEAELFGHERGAFTGANGARAGLIACADRGTLFLDEIGDMPPAAQVKLLRVLQEGEVRPIGGNRTIAVDLRVISATHRDLAAQIEHGSFREDLYYRLKVVALTLPPLDERREDIPLLVNHFLDRFADSALTRKRVAPKALELLAAAPWPGNVRELANVVEQLVALTPGPLIGARAVAATLGRNPAALPSYREARADFTRRYLAQLLSLCEGNVSAAARIAARDRSDFYKLLARHDIDPRQYKHKKRT